MKSVVVYASRSGNTRAIAEVVADVLGGHGPVRTVAAENASATVWEGADLLVVGGPTENRHATPPLHAFFDRLPVAALDGVAAAAFDTRLDWPRLLAGSAAADIRKWLRTVGADMLIPNESYIVSMEPRLHQGEIARARTWAATVAEVTQSCSSHGVRAAA